MTLPIANIPFINKRVKFPVTPHIPAGLTTPDQLRQIAAIAEKYGGSLKITGGGIVILGLSVADGEKALAELGAKPESFIAKAVRGVAVCPGKPHCPMARQDSTALGLALDAEFFGQPTPGKLRLGISGCPNCCAEVMVKDIGLYGTAEGFTVAVGGNAGRSAKIARVAAEGVPAGQIAPLVRSILAFYRDHGKDKERLGDTIGRVGWEEFLTAVFPPR
ncbi:nitrite reductase [Anaeroselena agilis]|uniref:Nitrite reductase n=1 Tax=Anaeroselena agilis TaxID=3063788 RepID=A0ABU3P294_9FIRM|nr:nitrite reductase [Selenomonadales bacterium 4137-cl]